MPTDDALALVRAGRLSEEQQRTLYGWGTGLTISFFGGPTEGEQVGFIRADKALDIIDTLGATIAVLRGERDEALEKRDQQESEHCGLVICEGCADWSHKLATECDAKDATIADLVRERDALKEERELLHALIASEAERIAGAVGWQIKSLVIPAAVEAGKD